MTGRPLPVDPGASGAGAPSRGRGVVGNFLREDGSLHTIPSRQAKLLVVLDHVAQVFEPGRRYPEPDVNRLLRRFHPDTAMLRRSLVDHAFLTRDQGTYWRSGGTFEV